MWFIAGLAQVGRPLTALYEPVDTEQGSGLAGQQQHHHNSRERTHDAEGLALLDRLLPAREVGMGEVVLRDLDVEVGALLSLLRRVGAPRLAVRLDRVCAELLSRLRKAAQRERLRLQAK